MKRNLDYIVRKLYGDNKDIVPSMEIRRSSFSMLYYITLNKNNIIWFNNNRSIDYGIEKK